MDTKYFVDKLKTELKNCTSYAFDPFIYASNWEHIKKRIEEHSNVILDEEYIETQLKSFCKQWLQYYKTHDENGEYQTWLDNFWTSSAPSEKEEKTYMMRRLYNSLIISGEIEELWYKKEQDKKRFLEKWRIIRKCGYDEAEDEYLYVGKRDAVGDFYYGYSDFYEPVSDVEQAPWWKFISKITAM